MTEVVNDAYFKAQAGAVGLFERIITGLHQELNSIGTGKKTRGRKSKDHDDNDFSARRRASLEKEIEMCQRYRMYAMRDIGIPVETIAVMVSRDVEAVEAAMRLVQYENIPSNLIPYMSDSTYQTKRQLM